MGTRDVRHSLHQSVRACERYTHNYMEAALLLQSQASYLIWIDPPQLKIAVPNKAHSGYVCVNTVAKNEG